VKKYCTLFLIVFLLLLFPKTIKAYCSDQNIIRLTNMAKNIKISYSYSEKNDSVRFNIILINLNKELIVVDAGDSKNYNQTGEITLKGYYQSSNNKYYIYAKDKSCTEDLLYTKYIKLPIYNEYYNDSICKGIENTSYCQKFTNKRYEYDEIDKYINSLKIDDKKDIKKLDNKSIFSSISSLYSKYYYFILPILITISCYGIYIQNKKDDLI